MNKATLHGFENKRSNPRPYTQDIGMHEYYDYSDYGVCGDSIFAKGLFKNYVDKFLPFSDHLSPFVDSFYLMKVDIFGRSL